MTFSELGLSQALSATVKKIGYTEPTEIQKQAIPYILEGRDLIATAETGTGKTAAFCLPCIDRIPNPAPKTPTLLILSPTRELATQISNFCRLATRKTKLHTVCAVGGVAYSTQIKRLEQGAAIVIATPGRLVDLINRKAIDLSQVSMFVFDEADRMLDMGFLPDVRRIMDECPKDRQDLLFSATMDKKALAPILEQLVDPAKVEVAQKGDVAETIDQYIVPTKTAVKPALLQAILAEHGHERVIVFTRTKRKADICVRRLIKAGFRADSIHADRTQSQRRRALDAFSKGKLDILVATDVLARGVDITEVSYVVNYDLPDQAEDYIHRIGRTGRAGATGFAISMVTPDTRSNLREIERLLGEKIPKIIIKDFDEAEHLREEMARNQHFYDKNDPDIAQAVKEFKQIHKRKKKAHEGDANAPQAGNKPQHKKKKRFADAKTTDAPSRAEDKKPKPKQKPKLKAKHKPGVGAKKPERDMRPGRARRAEVSARRSTPKKKKQGFKRD